MPTYTLYGHANTASTSIHWLLAELAQFGVTYDFVDINLARKEQKEDAYLAKNPKGRVPTLLIGNEPVTEAGAISLLLAERHPEAHLSPAEGTAERAKFLETHIFIVNSMLPALRDWFYADKDQTDPQYAHGIRLLTLRRLQDIFAYLDARLENSRFLASREEPTTTDFLFTATLSWNGFIDALASRYPNLKRYRDEMRARDSWKLVEKKEDITLTMRDFEEKFLADLPARL
jgi:glutathione S-transferase